MAQRRLLLRVRRALLLLRGLLRRLAAPAAPPASAAAGRMMPAQLPGAGGRAAADMGDAGGIVQWSNACVQWHRKGHSAPPTELLSAGRPCR